jgi:hypothetical protein
MPFDPVIDGLLWKFGPWGFPIIGLVWSVAVEVAALLTLHGLGVSAQLFDHADASIRRTVMASTFLLDVAGPPVIWTLYAWLRRASPQLLKDLEHRGVFVDDPTAEERPARRARSAGGIADYAWIAGLAVAGVGAIQHFVRPPGWNAASMLHAQLRLAVSIPLWYLLWMSVVVAGVLIADLRTAFTRRRLTLYAFHPDGFGGLGPLSAYIRTVIYFMLAISGLLAVAVVLATATSQLSGERLDRVLIAYVGVFLTAAPAALFAMIWPAHAAMLRARVPLERAVAALAAHEAPRLHTLERSTLTREALDRVDEVRRAHDLLNAFPVWPVNPARLRRALAGIFSPLFIGIFTDIVLRIILRQR